MPYDWPEEADFASWETEVLDRDCPVCGRGMHVCDHRYRRFHTLQVPSSCSAGSTTAGSRLPGHTKTKSPETEVALALPKWAIGWDVFCWIGHRRCWPPWRSPRSGPNSGTTTRSSSPRTPSTGTSDVTRSCSRRGSQFPSRSADTTPRRRSSSTVTPRSGWNKFRGLRTIEQAVLARPKAVTGDDLTPEGPQATVTTTAAADLPPATVDPAGDVVLDYLAAVRGSSTTIRVVRCILRACGWPKR